MDREFGGKNPYYSPELCGLKQMDMIETEPHYDFDMVVIWQDKKTKKFYFAADSGCSCPSPFEDVRRLSDLGKLNKTNFKGLEDAVHGLSPYRSPDSQTRSLFISKWRKKIFN